MRNTPGFGSEFKRLVRETPGAPAFWMGAFGEMLPRAESRVTINKDRKDARESVAHIECAYGDNEREMAKDQIETMKETTAGWEIPCSNQNTANPGLCILTRSARPAWATTRKFRCLTISIGTGT